MYDMQTYKLVNNTEAELHGIPAGDSVVCWFNYFLVTDYGHLLCQSINSGDLTGQDIDGNTLDAAVAAVELDNLIQESTKAQGPYFWNIYTGVKMLCKFRTYAATQGVTPADSPAMLAALADVVQLLYAGMLQEAAAAILLVTEDTVITADIKTKYSELLLAADAANRPEE